MLKNKQINLFNDLIKKKEYIKKEIKYIILKSIINSKNTKPFYRKLANLKLIKFNKKSFLSNQNNNICIKTGKIKSNLKIVNLDRHFIKKIALENNLQNFKINNW